MQVTIFSFLSALLWSSLLIVAIYLLRHTRFKQHFGVLSMVLLYLFCAVRLFLPLEFPHTLIAADGVIYPHIYNLLTRERDMLATSRSCLSCAPRGCWDSASCFFAISGSTAKRYAA